MIWRVTRYPNSHPVKISWVLMFLLGAWQTLLMPVLAAEMPRRVDGGEHQRKVGVSGTLSIGQFNYRVSGNVIQVADRFDALDLSVRTGQSAVSSIRVSSLPDGRLEMTYAGQKYFLPSELGNAWASFLALPAAELGDTRRFKRIDGEVGKSWESVAPISIRPDFPAKIRFVFAGTSKDGPQSESHPSEIVLFSLEEWNNFFDLNVVLRLCFSVEGES